MPAVVACSGQTVAETVASVAETVRSDCTVAAPGFWVTAADPESTRVTVGDVVVHGWPEVEDPHPCETVRAKLSAACEAADALVAVTTDPVAISADATSAARRRVRARVRVWAWGGFMSTFAFG
ncbi:hypothetical protein Microterr_01820 [Microbacterium terricola]|uniref:Uncharacterized protein n=1 Tax=Microbacterium terricola TaxID=344163 RepID=A0ABM8DV80_9MICO|nr:hypothetical protein Microterr_01820 [Microbacterium terricola]